MELTINLGFFYALNSGTSLAFIAFGLRRLWTLRYEPVKVEPNWLGVIKPVCILSARRVSPSNISSLTPSCKLIDRSLGSSLVAAQ